MTKSTRCLLNKIKRNELEELEEFVKNVIKKEKRSHEPWYSMADQCMVYPDSCDIDGSFL